MTLPAVVITGVSTGIGYATAQAAISGGMHVFGSVRNQQDAPRLLNDFPHSFTPLLFDVTDHAAIQAAVPVTSGLPAQPRLL